MIARRPVDPSRRATRLDWQVARPRTLVDHAVDAVISAAAQGHILPGDRIVEPDLAHRLGMSRVPIREALRILESQGVVTSEPYKGIRLMEVTAERLDHIIDVRMSLEALACRRGIERGRTGPPEAEALDEAIAELRLMSERSDAYGFATADADFHRALCGFAGNPVASTLWESLARQLTIIFGLATFGKPMVGIVDEHQVLRDVYLSGDIAKTEAAMREHIFDQAHDFDIEAVIAERRAAIARTANEEESEPA